MRNGFGKAFALRKARFVDTVMFKVKFCRALILLYNTNIQQRIFRVCELGQMLQTFYIICAYNTVQI